MERVAILALAPKCPWAVRHKDLVAQGVLADRVDQDVVPEQVGLVRMGNLGRMALADAAAVGAAAAGAVGWAGRPLAGLADRAGMAARGLTGCCWWFIR